MTTSQYIKKIEILCSILTIGFAFGCSSNQIPEKNNLGFCKSKYGHFAMAIPEMKGHFINSSNRVEDSVSGFVCSYNLEETQSTCAEGTSLKPSRDGIKYCDSKLFSTKELYTNEEIRKYFNEEDYKKTFN